MTVEEMKIQELASRYATDFFTRHPVYRTRKQLAWDIESALRVLAGIPEKKAKP